MRLTSREGFTVQNLSIMLFPFHRGLTEGLWTPEELLRSFREAGIRGIEPMQNRVWRTPDEWAAFDAARRDADMVYTCYDVMVNLVGETKADREQAVENAIAAIAHARDVLQCPTVLLAGSRPAEGMSNEDGRAIYAEQLARVIDQTRDCGVTVTIEDFGVYPAFVAAGRHCLEVLEEARRDDLRFTFDNGNFLLGGDRPLDVLDILYPYTAHVHIKDFTTDLADGAHSLPSQDGLAYGDCLIGDGDGQVQACVRKLRHLDYDGWVSLEMGGGDVLARASHGARVVTEAWEQA
jgi:sugar phosphate isomerase/epimerase